MPLLKLSGRMERLASKVTKGSRLADVGTDHGYIPISLILRGQIQAAVAMDIGQGPLERAKEHIQAYGLDTYIKTRLSDGLTKLAPGEADTVLIAGMGGALTARILENGGHCLQAVKELILQPQSEIFKVRTWLCENGFVITEEDIVLDMGKYYPIIKAVHGRPSPMSMTELAYGKAELQKSPAVLSSYLHKELDKNRGIMEEILAQNGREDSPRVRELKKKCGYICEMLQMLDNEAKKDNRRPHEV